MRRADREVKDPARIAEILAACKVCRLGLNDDGEVYVVPMNFGYVWEAEQLTLYFHCATEGRRLSILAKQPKVCFEMDCGHALTGEGDTACRYSYRFSSIIGTGTAELLETAAEKAAGLARVMVCQTGRDFALTEEMVKNVAVFRVPAEQFCCKVHE